MHRAAPFLLALICCFSVSFSIAYRIVDYEHVLHVFIFFICRRKHFQDRSHLTVRRDDVLGSAMRCLAYDHTISINNLSVDFYNEPGNKMRGSSLLSLGTARVNSLKQQTWLSDITKRFALGKNSFHTSGCSHSIQNKKREQNIIVSCTSCLTAFI